MQQDKERKLYSKLYKAGNNKLACPHEEPVFCYIQDRNVFWGQKVSVNTAISLVKL
ncbi:hypothetical protein CWI38_0746p0030 [Hamiltosporidium tvaerminnensis]|uniref:Uncharacterized protein n=1 Tax=Hamiltosporidium tvaerminnensis TaxID=1176355 RepID=A0A4Q9LV60_9MICR|nr:hypothetical protein CWI38_0957p0010 [Hamiltosporidium tvaerminnensis]TBU12464.1 hypothetical protein CWI38_0746p0030 [Hamiltosporidium tvaerminnensis]